MILVILVKCPLAHHIYIYYHHISFDLYTRRTLHHVSKYGLTLQNNEFIDVRCKKWEDLTFFWNLLVFITTSTSWQSLLIFQCLISIFNYLPVLPNVGFLYYFRAVLKRLTINSSAIMYYVMKTKNIKR